jgi:ubiquinol-cytochrome c reductase cytochrome c1 subunit
MGYEDAPEGVSLEDGVYYNKYMSGNKIKMAQPLMDGAVTYMDGAQATEMQMAKDVATFLTWAAEPHLEARHKMGFKAIVYLIIITILVYFSMKKLWSRIETKV